MEQGSSEELKKQKIEELQSSLSELERYLSRNQQDEDAVRLKQYYQEQIRLALQ